jgi:hypothetical protein
MRGRNVATRWPVTADVKESPPERRPNRKRFAQGVLLGAAATAIAGLAFLAVFDQETGPAPDPRTTTRLPEPPAPEPMPVAPEIVPGLGRLAEQAAAPAAPAEPTMPPAMSPPASLPTTVDPAVIAPSAPAAATATAPPATDRASPERRPAPAGDIASGTESAPGSEAIAPPPPVARTVPMPAEKPAAAQPPVKRPAAPQGSVTRMRLAERMEGLEPGPGVALPIRRGRTIYFFTELKGLAGRPIVHRWHWEGRVVQDRAVRPSSPAWRAYTAKAIDRRGAWQVTVVDTATGSVLAEHRFDAK